MPDGDNAKRRDTGAPRNSVLVERECELEQIARILDNAGNGAGGVVVIEAAPGTGKSSLLAEAQEMASSADMTLLAASGSELERGFPFGVAIALLEPLWTSADRAEREALGTGPAGLARQLLDGRLPEASPSRSDHGYPLIRGLYWLVCNIASPPPDRPGRPIALIVDDIHWADRPSLRLLAYLAARLPELPVALIVAMRQGEDAADPLAVAALQGAPGAALLTPAPLTDRGVEKLVRAEYDNPTREFILACSRATRGNPFLATELLAQMRSDQRPPDAQTAKRVAELAPEAIVNSVVARLGVMSPSARAFAMAVAVLGDRSGLRDAARLAELDPGDASQAADALAAAQLLRPGVPLTFAQPMIRAAVLASIPPLTRGRAHRLAATILREDGAPAEAVVAHLLVAPPDHDPLAIADLRVAARDALASGEPDSAVRLLERALAERPSAETYPDVLAELGQAEALAGLPQAPDRLRDAISITDEPVRRAQLALTQGHALISQASYRDATVALDRGLRELGGADPRLADELDSALIVAGALVPDMVEQAFDRRQSMLERLGDSPSPGQRMALATSVVQDSMRGSPRSSVRRLADLAWGDGALRDADPEDELGFSSLTGALLFADELEREIEICDAALAAARDRDLPLAYATVSHSRVWAVYERGQITEARAEAKAALDAPSDGDHHVRTAYGALACCDLLTGRLEQAERAVAIVEDGDVRLTIRHPFLLEVRAQLRLAQHRPREALQDALYAGSELESDFGVANPGVVAWRSTAALAHLALGNATAAEALAAEELGLAQAAGVTRIVIRDLRVLGLAAGGAAGIELLEEAVRAGEHYPMRLETICALVDLGGALRRAKKRSDAREPLQRAFDLSESGGASALARRAQAEFEATGARSRRALLTGIESLTPSEGRVAELAARGMTTRQIAEALFVSPKTVEFHLRHIYRKLDISSRSQLANVFSDTREG